MPSLVTWVAAIETRFGRRPPQAIFKGGSTIQALVTVPAGEASSNDRDALVALQPLGDLSPFYCVHGIDGDVQNFDLLAGHMAPRQPFLAFRNPPNQFPAPTIEQTAARYVRELVTYQSDGAITLGGYSLGAVIAYEMVRQLLALGRRVDLLVIIDQPRPNWRLTGRNTLPSAMRSLMGLPAYIYYKLSRLDSRMSPPPGVRGAAAMLSRSGNHDFLRAPRFAPDQVPAVEAYMDALRRYSPTPCRVPTVVFRATFQPLRRLCRDAGLGWRDLVTDVSTIRVPGNHYTITREPRVRALAAGLTAALSAAGDGGKSR